jgi:superfamily II DNA helicase RecQ
VQRDGLRLIARCRPENLIITLTGNSKTILYVIATLLPRAEVTVVIVRVLVPLIALRQDLLDDASSGESPSVAGLMAPSRINCMQCCS